jgi:transposase
MKAYSLDFRKRIVAAHLVEKMSIRKVATQFAVSKSLVQKLVNLQRTEGNLQPKQTGKPQFSYLRNAEPEVKALVAAHPDATLAELCELFAIKTGNWVSRTAMCRCLQKLGLNRKKKTWYSSQAATERVQHLRVEYWDSIKHIEPENLVFLDETGILLGLTRTYARSCQGTRVTELKPFYRGEASDSYWRN